MLWNECTRLIANAVVYYNSAILSELLAALERLSNQTAIDTLQRVTPLAWQHIDFYGCYIFGPLTFGRWRPTWPKRTRKNGKSSPSATA